MNTELISVVVPVYNVEKYLDKCIKSIMNQTYTYLELILVDDGSTDGSGRICDVYAGKDARICVIHQKNTGRSGARNAGLEKASGEYVMFVDGDDWIDDCCLEDVYRFFVDDIEMVVFRERHVYADRVEDSGSNEYMQFVGSEPLEFYVKGRNGFQQVNSVCGKLYRRSFLQDIRFVEGKYYEDIMFTTKVYATCRNCIYLDKAYYNYNIATDSSITYRGVNELTFRDEIPAFYEKKIFLQNMGRKDLADRYSYFIYQRLILYYTECIKKREYAYARKLVDIIEDEKDNVKEILKKDYVSRYYKVYIPLFMINPRLAYLWGILFEKIVKLRN